LVAHPDNDPSRIIGMVFCAPQRDHPNVAQLCCLYVVPSARRQGVGSSLLKAAMDRAGAMNMQSVQVLAATANPAVRLYAPWGFKPIRPAEFPGYTLLERMLCTGEEGERNVR